MIYKKMVSNLIDPSNEAASFQPDELIAFKNKFNPKERGIILYQVAKEFLDSYANRLSAEKKREVLRRYIRLWDEAKCKLGIKSILPYLDVEQSAYIKSILKNTFGEDDISYRISQPMLAFLNLSNAKLDLVAHELIFIGVNFKGADFSRFASAYSHFQHCEFNGIAVSKYSNFSKGYFVDCNFNGVDLSKLSGNPKFIQCEMIGVKVTKELNRFEACLNDERLRLIKNRELLDKLVDKPQYGIVTKTWFLELIKAYPKKAQILANALADLCDAFKFDEMNKLAIVKRIISPSFKFFTEAELLSAIESILNPSINTKLDIVDFIINMQNFESNQLGLLLYRAASHFFDVNEKSLSPKQKNSAFKRYEALWFIGRCELNLKEVMPSLSEACQKVLNNHLANSTELGRNTPFYGFLNLSGIDLDYECHGKLQFIGINFSGANLSYFKTPRADFYECRFNEITFGPYADFFEGNFVNCDFSGIDKDKLRQCQRLNYDRILKPSPLVKHMLLAPTSQQPSPMVIEEIKSNSMTV